LQITKLRRTGAVLLTAGAVTGVAIGGTAHAQDYDIRTGPVTVKMKLKGKRPFFSATGKTISRGEKLTVVNTTKIQQIGPHTFSLVKPAALPKTAKKAKACGEKLKGICGKIARAHKFDPKTQKINKPDLDVGGKGWNTSFGRKGDSWYTEVKGDIETRKVTAPVGTTLTYFCAVHPNMVGKLKVVK
jgi:plastocyanin